jgi:hypothetical protein
MVGGDDEPSLPRNVLLPGKTDAEEKFRDHSRK